MKEVLASKFRLKYGDKGPIAKFIDIEVAKFLKNERLTEANLAKLDHKIAKEVELREKKEAILDERRSERGDKWET